MAVVQNSNRKTVHRMIRTGNETSSRASRSKPKQAGYGERS